MENSKVLLLGATGRLGRMLAAFWPVPDDLILQSRRPAPGCVVADPLADPAALAQTAAGTRAVICLAGVTPALAAASGQAMHLNTDLSLAALQAAHAAGAGRVFLASSAAVYGRAGEALHETRVCRPASPYGQAKLDMEKTVSARARTLGHPVTALRIGNVAGADAILGGWSPGMALDTLADGTTPLRSYIGPQTLARVIHRLTMIPELPPVLNIAAPGAVAIGSLLDAAGLPWSRRPAGPNTISRVVFDTQALEQRIDFSSESRTPAGIVAEWRCLIERVSP